MTRAHRLNISARRLDELWEHAKGSSSPHRERLEECLEEVYRMNEEFLITQANLESKNSRALELLRGCLLGTVLGSMRGEVEDFIKECAGT